MHSKKIVAVLLTVGVVASTFAIFNQINMKGAFADTIKQNVVYTKEDTSSVSQDDGTGKITGDEKEAYRQKSLDILKEYFNISSVEENEDFKFGACILNEKTLDAIKPLEKKIYKIHMIRKKYLRKNMIRKWLMLKKMIMDLRIG
ncbi:uncharacterized protein YxeA [Clostridium beijerinckii]|nr:hypothetical protein [Clostridium beijerinckii]NRW26059.1 uncharacterized protein YxeA [Clostridium beijerinckii]NSA04289.1 uncharacterized protein YxeA [Clostridium beijerinckii]